MATEHDEQRMFVGWFRATFPGVRIFAIPNGGGRSPREGAKLRDEGVSPGVPDLFVPEWCLWVEMKRASGGVVSAVQADWHRYLKSIGHAVMVCHGYAQARTMVLAWKADE